MARNYFGFVFKPIEEFTVDDCFVRIEQNRIDGVDSDAEHLKRYTVLLSSLQQKDNAMFIKATNKTALQKYISLYPLDNSNLSLRVYESQSWITATDTSKGRIKISVSYNKNSARSGYVTVRCGNERCKIDIRQSGWTNCYYCGGRGQVQCGYPALWITGMHSGQQFVMNYYTGGVYYTDNPCPSCGGSGGVTCTHSKGKIKSN